MRDYIVLDRCTVQRRDGSFCDSASAEDVPFPICQLHLEQIRKHLDEAPGLHAELVASMRAARLARLAEEFPPRPQQPSRAPLVYYVRLPGDRIKIGTTINLRQRLIGLRVPLEAVLATEPGDHIVEQRRHRQFAHLRIGRLEDFAPADDLLTHIARLART